jgi:hypothetical protein
MKNSKYTKQMSKKVLTGFGPRSVNTFPKYLARRQQQRLMPKWDILATTTFPSKQLSKLLSQVCSGRLESFVRGPVTHLFADQRTLLAWANSPDLYRTRGEREMKQQLSFSA